MAIIKMPRSKRAKQNSGRSGGGGAPPSNEWDNVCSFCDDGGDLLCCDGGCLRSFHPTKQHGKDARCTTLKLTQERWQVFNPKDSKEKAEEYICKNCVYKQHQCFACGLLGSSDSSSGPEVFQCKEKTCGHFYHPKCVSKLLFRDSKTQAFRCKQQVADGVEFVCPMHKCARCNEAENMSDKSMQFALCRRCPTAYHRKCLPSDICFKADEKKDTRKRAWGNIFADRILIYCTKHEINRNLGTPKRGHIVFPDPHARGRNLVSSASAGVVVVVDCYKEQAGDDELVDDGGPSPSSEPSQAVPVPAAGLPDRLNPVDLFVPRDDELVDDDGPSLSSEPSQPAPAPVTVAVPAARLHGRLNPVDSFVPKHLFPHPNPGSCGWITG